MPPDPTAATFAEVFARLEKAERGVAPADVRAAFDAILAGAWTPVQIGAYATALRMRGETAEAIGAAASALREVMAAVDHGLDEVIDTCGTGGDGAHTINVSTGAAVVVAACNVHVAKHGNRSVSSRCGSADVVEALGIPIDVPTSRQAGVLRAARITFLMAPAHHPALRHAAQARRELGVRTIFNALGPLVNPARVTHQLVGVYDDALRPILAHALGALGLRRAWVVRSEDGLDEVSPCAPTRASVLEDGRVTERTIAPEELGLARIDLADLRGGDATENAAVLERVLGGGSDGNGEAAARIAVVANAAAALCVMRGGALRDRAREAADAIDSGAAKRTLEGWREAAVRAKNDGTGAA